MISATEAQRHSGLNFQTSSEKSNAMINDELPYTIDDVLLKRLHVIPDEPLVGYPKTLHGMDDYVYYTPKQLDLFTNGAVAVLSEAGIKKVGAMPF
jgi:hypothetical protein